ncbi:Homeodomain-like protein [Cordyceps militaris CM01]|uniref:Homeodomain-like protein n=1 Tax=Cordyceps militaris (strain CM01) TaxID=983644 RepID=G3J7G1_CORMM|nr:Homeodomain-like protein [Cordyceps militaris CM01]EGX97127.1 Homeodomain-like protein [Cordyceps militaris CM01]
MDNTTNGWSNDANHLGRQLHSDLSYPQAQKSAKIMESGTSQTDEPSGNDIRLNSSNYPHGSWHNASPYSQSPYENSPLNEYANYQHYVHHPISLTGLPAILPNSHMAHGGSMAHQDLPMLTTTTWPSELTHTQSSAYSVSSSTIASAAMPSITTAKPAEKTRKTLTFEQKRDMCLYHEQHPKTRQADIGQVFRVERSTVSKVLRNKEMYLKGEIEKDSNGKRTNGKNPDFDRTLGNYIRRQRDRGIPMSDSDIMDRAYQYARGSPNHQAILEKLTQSWLNKFKQRYSLDTAGMTRRASEPSIPEKLSISARFQSISPSPPSTQTSPLSVSPSDDDLRSRGDYSFTYRQYASHSETSLTDHAASSFSSELISPVAPFGYSPDGPPSAFPLDPEFEATAAGPKRHEPPFRPMELEYPNQHMHANAGDAVLITPRNIPPPVGNKSMSSPVADHRAASHTNGRLDDKQVKAEEAGTLHTAPGPEDAQRAAATLLNYFQNFGPSGQFDHECSAILQLTRKLHTQSNLFSHPDGSGLTRIGEGDADLITAGGGHRH